MKTREINDKRCIPDKKNKVRYTTQTGKEGGENMKTFGEEIIYCPTTPATGFDWPNIPYSQIKMSVLYTGLQDRV